MTAFTQVLALAIISSAAAVRDQGLIECDQIVSGSTADGVHTLGQSSPEHVYNFTVAAGVDSQLVKFSTCGSSFDTWLRIVNVGTGAAVVNCDDCGSCGVQTVIQQELPAGDYAIIVEGYRGNNGVYTMAMTCPTRTSQDNLSAVAAECGSTYAGNTDLAAHLLGSQSGEHLYTLNLTAAVTDVVLDACGSDYDSYLRVFEGSCVGACTRSSFGAAVVSRDDGQGCDTGVSGHRTRLSHTFSAGVYTVVVEGYSRNTGNYNLAIGCTEQTTSTRAPGTCAPDEHMDQTSQTCERNTVCTGHEAHTNDAASGCFRLRVNYFPDFEVAVTGTTSETSADYFREVPGLDRSVSANEHLTEVALPVNDAIVHCASEHARGGAGMCTCHGTMWYGMWRGTTHRWSRRRGASGSYACSNTVFGDPWRGVVKRCYCDSSDTTTAGTQTDAVSIESCAQPGKYLVVASQSSSSNSVKLLARDNHAAEQPAWFDASATWVKTVGHSGRLASAPDAQQVGGTAATAVGYESFSRRGFFMVSVPRSSMTALYIAPVNSRNARMIASRALYNKIADDKVVVPSDEFDASAGYCRGAGYNSPRPTSWVWVWNYQEAKDNCTTTVGCTGFELQHCQNNRDAPMANRTRCRFVMYFHADVTPYGADQRIGCFARRVMTADATATLSAAAAAVDPSCPTVASAGSVAACESQCAFPAVNSSTRCAESISQRVVTESRRTNSVVTSAGVDAEGCPLAHGRLPNCYRSCVAQCTATVAAPDPATCFRLTSRNYGYQHRAGLRPPIRAQLDRAGFDISENGRIDDYTQNTFRFVTALMSAEHPAATRNDVAHLATAGLPAAAAAAAAATNGAYTVCAYEGGNCACAGTIMYGYAARWATRENVTGSTRCTNGVFGDPYYGRRKECRCFVPQQQTTTAPAAVTAQAMSPLVSIESCQNPGRYLMANFGTLADVGGADASVDFARRSTFVKRQSEYYSGYFTLEPLSQPNTRVRHQGYRLKLHQPQSTTLYQEDASFKTLAEMPAFAAADFRTLSTDICEGSRQTLLCPSGSRITITDAWYGRRDMTTCRSSRCPADATGAGDCRILRTWLDEARHPAPTHCFRNDTTSIRAACDGNAECQVHSSNSGGDPCYYTYKYTHVEYSCSLPEDTIAAMVPVELPSEDLFEYVSANATAVADRACSPCGNCNPPTYRAAECTEFAATQCASAVLNVTFVPVPNLPAPLPVQQCAAAQYEHRAATLIADRQCAECSVCHPGWVMVSDCTGTSNRVCETVGSGAGHFTDTDNAVAPGTPVSVCGAGSAVLDEPTPSSDRTCIPCQVSETFSTEQNSEGCRRVSDVCRATQYETDAPTATSDRVCADVTPCLDTEFMVEAPSYTSDRVCDTLTVCGADQFESLSEGESTDRECSQISTCTYYTETNISDDVGFTFEYESVAPGDNNDRECLPLAVCAADDEYESEAPTETTDRECLPHPVCDNYTQYESVAPATNGPRVCAAIDDCDAGSEYETAAPTGTSNRQCAALTNCDGHNQYETVAPTTTSNRECTALTRCDGNSNYQTVPPTASSDRQCAALTMCNATLEYQTVPPTASSDRKCATLTVCDFASHFEETAKTATSDRVCTAKRVCAVAEFQLADATATTDRVCKIAAICTQGAEYEAVAMTAVSDRFCLAYSVCGSTEYQTAAPTATTDRECALPTVCSAIEYTTVEFTATANRECGNLTVCLADQYQTLAATSDTDRECATATVCTDTEYQTEGRTETTDRLCANLTTCDSAAGEYELVAQTVTADRLCGLPTLIFSADFNALFPAGDREALLASFQTTLVDTLAPLLKDLNPPSLFAVYEGSVLVTLQYDDNYTADALEGVIANCGIRFTFNGNELSPSPIASPGSCDITTQAPVNINDFGDAQGASGSDTSSDDSSDDSSASFAGVAGAGCVLALVALVAVTGKRRSADSTKGTPIQKDAVDAAGLNPLYAGQTGTFSHNDRGAATMIAGEEQVYSDPSGVAPRPGDANYEAYYDSMHKSGGVEVQNAMYSTAYVNETRRPSGQLESGYTFGAPTEATYDVGNASGATTEATYDVSNADEHLVGAGADYASNDQVGTTAIYDMGTAADATIVAEPTYDMGAAAEADPTYDIGSSEHTYGVGSSATLTAENPLNYEAIGDLKNAPAKSDLIYDNTPAAARQSDDETYGLVNGSRSNSYSTATAAPVSNIDAVYDQ